MNFVSCFSGIEAASVAWHPLGFKCLAIAEVDPFSCAVLAHHYPDVPNLGDVLADNFLDRIEAIDPDALVGGPPCQDFSVAGLRAGIHGHRGNLTLRWVQIIHASHARFAVTENVPGWLSANKGHAFGAFLAGLVGHDTDLLPPKDCGGRWTNAGLVAGPNGRAAWRILDAQYFGLAQRRKRVFVVFCPGHQRDPAAVLLEPQSLCRDPPPRCQAGERITGTLESRADAGGGGWGTDWLADGGMTVAKSVPAQPWSSHREDSETFVSMALNAHGGSGRMDGESETFVTHSLRADGFDASEDGTGRGTPLVPVSFESRYARNGRGAPSEIVSPLKAQSGQSGKGDAAPLVAFPANLSGTQRLSAEDVSPSMGAKNPTAVAFNFEHGLAPHGSLAGSETVAALGQSEHKGHTGVLTPPVASFQQSSLTGRGTFGYEEDTKTLRPVKPQPDHQMLQQGSAVRRLTPVECARLQGFPDDYLDITYRGKPAADGPKYRALGNSFAVPVVRWIGEQIAKVEAER